MPIAPGFLLRERYDVVEELGRGGHAVVYRAHDRALERDVAIKVLREDVLAPDIRARFTQEVQLMARLEHAHILRVHDSGTEGAQPFVVMELAPSQTLAHRLAREPQLPLTDALQITREVGSALAHAHAQGILHRDVKPENILIGQGGALLADFGIARITGELAISRITSTGEAVGTLQYMSPEQLCAEPVDARSDQYALACVLYEMLAGVKPHAAATFEGLRALRLTGRHSPVSVYRASISPALAGALERAMSVAPADRFRSMEEFLIALELVRTGETFATGGNRPRPHDGAPGELARAPLLTRTRVWASALALLMAVGGWTLADATWPSPFGLTADDEPVLANGDTLSTAIAQRLRDELVQWTGKATPIQVRVSARGDGDTLEVRVSSRGSPASPRLFRAPRRSEQAVAQLVSEIASQQYGGRTSLDLPDLRRYTGRSIAAVHAYSHGHTMLERAAFDSAGRLFDQALTADPTFDAADYWRAIASYWGGLSRPAAWRVPARATRATDTLLARRAQAAADMMRMRFATACDHWQAAVTHEAERFDAQFMRARCLQLDSLVIESAGAVRFRQSSWQILRGYEAAVQLAPTAALLHALMNPIWAASFARGSDVRAGRSDSGAQYYAMPGLDADTIAVRPVEARLFAIGGGDAVPGTWTAALRRGRALMFDVTEAWVQRMPSSPEAWWHHARALELSGRIAREPGHAPDALAKASALRRGALRDDMLRMEVRLALRRGELGEARRLAEQGLAAPDLSPAVALPLAALAGDTARVEREAVHASSGRPLPLALDRALEQFTIYAQVGHCAAAARLREDVEHLLRTTIAAAQVEVVRRQWMSRALRAAVPCFSASILRDMPPSAPMDSVYAALREDDVPRARRALLNVQRRRAGATTAALTWDYIFAEAWAWLASGDTTAAVAHVEAGLDDLAGMSLYTLDDPAQAAGLRRSLELLVQIRQRNGQPITARSRDWDARARQFLHMR